MRTISILLLLVLPSVSDAQATGPATYELAFESFWTVDQIEADQLPGSAHFTELVGAAHLPSSPLWQVGTSASQGD